MARVLCIRLAWLTMTPLGWLVEPEVYWSMASDSGAMTGGSIARPSASGISSVASHGIVEAVSALIIPGPIIAWC